MNTTATHAPLASTPSGPRPVYTRLAALGFGLIALTALVYLAFGSLAGDTGALAFIVVIALIALLVAGALLRFGAWAQVLAALLSFLLLALVVPFSTFDLLHPESAGDFIPILFLVAGAVFGFVGSMVGLVQRRRHTLRTTATRVESLALKATLGAIVVLAVFSLVLTAASRTTVSAASKAGAIGVEQRDARFTPDHIEVKAGDSVRVVVRNDDSMLHTFTLEAAHVDVSVPPGAERLIEFKAPPPGTYQWYCIPHSDPGPNGRTGMVGSLVVQ